MTKQITFWPSESCTREQADAVMASIRTLSEVEAVTCVKWSAHPSAVMGLYMVFLRDDADEVTAQQAIGDIPGVGWMLNAEGDPI